MSYRELPLSSLKINRANDRHGELENETAAIAWLFNNKEGHMKALAKDIVEKKGILEPPIVTPDGGEFVIFDGNRRVTCLKLIAEPHRAPTVELREFFESLNESADFSTSTKITCRVESDRDLIDAILYRRHTGSQGGVGQSTWDDRMKKNFVDRTGMGNGPDVAEAIEKRLSEAGKLPDKKKIPRSTLNRLLSSEAFRNRLGFSIKKGKFEYTHEESAVLDAIARVANDLANKEVVLGDLWDVAGKRKYIDRLESEGALPTAKQALSLKSAQEHETPQPRPRHQGTTRLERRSRLIRDVEYGIAWDGKHHRHRAIWEELQFKLELGVQPNAISALMRVLIEITIETYIETHRPPSVFPNDTLLKRLSKVAQELSAQGKITAKYAGDLGKLRHEDIISTDTLNRFVHSPNFTPSPDHITAIWDTLSEFIVACLKS